MEETPDNLTLMEPVSPETLLPSFSPMPWVLAGIILLILLVIGIAAVVLLIKTFKSPSTSIQQIAYKEACDSLNQIDTENAKETAVECSLILRSYLSKAVNEPALFETHEEFISRQDSLQSLSEETKQATHDGFNELASLKYSSDTPSQEPQSIISNSKALLETLNRGFIS